MKNVIDNGAVVRISPTAWLKIQALVMGYDKEVGWYATVEKLKDGEFRIKDVLVYPQIISSAFVEDTFINGDSSEMEAWMDTLTDEQFNERRGQGHSHVNMSVTPSSTDKDFWKSFAMSVSKTNNNPYVVTMIINKKLEMIWWICDWEEQREYKNDQITVLIEIEEGVSNIEFFAASKELVRERVSKPSAYYLFGGNSSPQSLSGDFLFQKKKEEAKKNVKSVKNIVNSYKETHVEEDVIDILPYDDSIGEYTEICIYVGADGEEINAFKSYDEFADYCDENNITCQKGRFLTGIDNRWYTFYLDKACEKAFDMDESCDVSSILVAASTVKNYDFYVMNNKGEVFTPNNMDELIEMFALPVVDYEVVNTDNEEVLYIAV